MKLVSQISRQNGPQQAPPSSIRLFLRRAGRLPWGKILWCLFALGTFLVAWRLVSVMAHAMQGLSAP